MKTTGVLTMLATASTTLVVVAVALTVVTVLENRELRSELRQAREEMRQAAQATRRLEDQRSSDLEALSAQRRQLQQLETEGATAGTAEETKEDPEVTSPRAFRVRTYAGGKYVGDSWMVPQPVPVSGTSSNIWQPTIVLDDAVRAALTPAPSAATAPAAAPERDTTRTVNVNYNYPNPYYVTWPYVWVSGGHQHPPPQRPLPASPPRPTPQQPSPFLNTRYFLPTQKPFLPSPSTYPGMTPPQATPGGSSPLSPGVVAR